MLPALALPLFSSALAASALPLAPAARAVSAHDNSTVAAAWFQGWDQDFTVANISWSQYTHVTYSFAIPTANGSLSLTESGNEEGLRAFVKAAHANNVKALASIGGWSGSRFYSSAVAPANVSAFVQTVSDFASTFELDGLDFDWEYPVSGGMTCNVNAPTDTVNLLSFLQAVHAANPELILTAAAGVAPWKDASGESGADVAAFADALDYVAIMNYDEFGQWSDSAGPNAALNDTCAPAAAQQGSAVSAVKAWTDAGVPANKLVLGVASYGHAFKVSADAAYASSSAPKARADGDCSDDAPATLALFPQFTKNANATDVDECGEVGPADVQYTFSQLITEGYLTANGTAADGIAYRFDACSQTPFVYNEDKEEYVSFDDARSFAAKGAYVRAAGLRGFAMWEASGDHDGILVGSLRAAVGL